MGRVDLGMEGSIWVGGVGEKGESDEGGVERGWDDIDILAGMKGWIGDEREDLKRLYR